LRFASRRLLAGLGLFGRALVKLALDLGRLRFGAFLGALLQCGLGLADLLEPRLLALQLPGQLVAALALAVLGVVLGVSLLGRGQQRLDLFVEPSRATWPSLTKPICFAISSTCTNRPASACRCRLRKAAMLSWSGCWLAASTRYGTSSYVARSILRDEGLPVQYAYTSILTIILGWYGGMPRPSPCS
jgi:hypothetical protein